jgi:hypothetical protein
VRLKKRITRKQKAEFAETTALAAEAKKNGHWFFYEHIKAAALEIIMTRRPAKTKPKAK